MHEMGMESGSGDEESESFYVKYVMDGAATLAGAAERLREAAEYLDGLVCEGWELDHEVEGGWAHMSREGSDPARPNT